ncbi:MAG TPA: hypothetical protein VFO60_05945 [Candidatus Dormibacteraeota bacterium]|nr:hypothetical protein [Candidatus Dormibacteraeota bacterium]
MDQWRVAIGAVVGFLILGLGAVLALDIVLAWGERPSIGHRIQRWSRRHPLYSLALVAIVGVMYAHFFIGTDYGPGPGG